MAREAMALCLRVLKESNKSRFDSYSVRNSVLVISHITFRDCRVQYFPDNLARNSCTQRKCQVLGHCVQFKSSALGRHERDLPLKTNWAVWMNNSEVSLWTFKISHIIPTKNNSLVVSKVSCDRIISKKSTAWLPGIHKEKNC